MLTSMSLPICSYVFRASTKPFWIILVLVVDAFPIVVFLKVQAGRSILKVGLGPT